MPPARPSSASNGFAHWNMFPFMTAPQTKYYSAQLQSPLFRLPRELRDRIYSLYMSEKDGYHYDSLIGKMKYHNSSELPQQVVRLGLRITCRIAAEEMRNIPFPTLNFYPLCSDADGAEYQKLRSRAGRFQCCTDPTVNHVTKSSADTLYYSVELCGATEVSNTRMCWTYATTRRLSRLIYSLSFGKNVLQRAFATGNGKPD